MNARVGDSDYVFVANVVKRAILKKLPVVDALDTQFDPTGRERFKSKYEKNVR